MTSNIFRQYFGRNTEMGRDDMLRLTIKGNCSSFVGDYFVTHAVCNTGGSFFDIPVAGPVSLQEANECFDRQVAYRESNGFVGINSVGPLPRICTKRISRDAIYALVKGRRHVLLPLDVFPYTVSIQRGVFDIRERFGARASINPNQCLSLSGLKLMSASLEGVFYDDSFFVTDVFEIDGYSCAHLPYLERMDFAISKALVPAKMVNGPDMIRVINSGCMTSTGFWVVRCLHHKPRQFNDDGDFWFDASYSVHAVVDKVSRNSCVVSLLGDGIGERTTFVLELCDANRFQVGQVVKVAYKWHAGKVVLFGQPIVARGMTWRDCSLSFLQTNQQSFSDVVCCQFS